MGGGLLLYLYCFWKSEEGGHACKQCSGVHVCIHLPMKSFRLCADDRDCAAPTCGEAVFKGMHSSLRNKPQKCAGVVVNLWSNLGESL